MEYQFIEYVESTGKDTSTMTEEELDAMRDSFLNGNFTHLNPLLIGSRMIS